MKALVGRALANRVKDGETIGLGSGTTVEATIIEIGKRISAEGLQVFAVPTSHRATQVARQSGIHVVSPGAVTSFSWAFDGADEIDENFDMIKGRGAAMLAEKISARKAGKLVIVVTEEKLVTQLGVNFAVPVEVIPEAHELVRESLTALGAKEVTLRAAEKKYGPVITEHGNLVLDAAFSNIQPELEGQINMLTGVVENGLFVGFKPEVLVARKEGIYSRVLTDGKITEKLVESTQS